MTGISLAHVECRLFAEVVVPLFVLIVSIGDELNISPDNKTFPKKKSLRSVLIFENEKTLVLFFSAELYWSPMLAHSNFRFIRNRIFRLSNIEYFE
ncbi:hypothetical protein Y032_0212g2248 [Ancylostoma ceylanicum]|uniref:Uncharacterized protein n=1 Tax=Ancylostoma ceylanicum TaxID=53326 RepID=A0A016SKS6_9BILA|nr:hypothetical protein Y032_0212g2248 [Ancylostoma ceylanicum]